VKLQIHYYVPNSALTLAYDFPC